MAHDEGVAIDQGFVDALLHPVTIGIALGLLLGKQLGIILFAWLMTRTGLAAKPEEVSWRQVYGARAGWQVSALRWRCSSATWPLALRPC
ncbi:MAG: hypothetical protein DWQ07_18325 [Chloroflexi bacterium]|nr:MAG: hypothetical protein DWQ07_18325 [Chloroflexota bacterium]